MTLKKRILIVRPHSIFTWGGTETVCERTADILRSRGHLVDIMGLPFGTQERESLARSTMLARLVNVEKNYSMERSDLVIGVKFPAYGVRHPNRVAWVLHQYQDAYQKMLVHNHLEYNNVRQDIAQFMFEYDKTVLPESRHIFTNSRITADRLSHFNDIPAEPLYTPSPMAEHLGPGEYGDYLLCPGRLERVKRPDLAVQAMLHAPKDLKLVLAGDGYMAQPVKHLIAEHGLADRVHLAGYVTEQELVKLYRNCLGLLYVPYDEDYGLVTVEAFNCRKPVVTCADSSGPLEFVREDETGYIAAKPKPELIGAAITKLWNARSKAADMGERGYQLVKGFSWEQVADAFERFVE